MTTPKRCEECGTCGKLKCSVTDGFHNYRCAEKPFDNRCHGHSSPPPRPDELESFKNKYGLGSLYTKQEAYLPNPYKEVYAEVMKDVEALLLSYGKEREREIFRKCREAKKVLKCRVDVDGGVCECCRANFDALDDYLDSVRPEEV